MNTDRLNESRRHARIDMVSRIAFAVFLIVAFSTLGLWAGSQTERIAARATVDTAYGNVQPAAASERLSASTISF